MTFDTTQLRTRVKHEIHKLYSDYMKYEGYKCNIPLAVDLGIKKPFFDLIINHLDQTTFEGISDEEMLITGGADENIAMGGTTCYVNTLFCRLPSLMQAACFILEFVHMNSLCKPTFKRRFNEPMNEQSAEQFEHMATLLLLDLNLYKDMDLRPIVLPNGKTYIGFTYPKRTAEKMRLYVGNLLNGEASIGTVQYRHHKDDISFVDYEVPELMIMDNGHVTMQTTKITGAYIDTSTLTLLDATDPRAKEIKKEYDLIETIKKVGA